ncbi:type II secretion system minor pseudopilin GspI [Thalassotalea crassostreae]|uniref:type II secretion system minor pseudopilin GspI n=1 Tax=Thalassotalea crassostreae TaxID=1763536 RepID=UPI000839287F|nr:type II secretion system minor pseudopilin GspI [Thalassotalea crassostreae]
MMKFANQHKGFTLLEVLLALAVFAFAGTALLSSTGNTLLGTSHIERVTLAQWIASNQLVEANLDQNWPPKKASGTVELADRDWYWTQTITATEDKNMRHINVAVFENESDEFSIADLTSYVSNPKASK